MTFNFEQFSEAIFNLFSGSGADERVVYDDKYPSIMMSGIQSKQLDKELTKVSGNAVNLDSINFYGIKFRIYVVPFDQFIPVVVVKFKGSGSYGQANIFEQTLLIHE